ncbi:hypothetical protein RU639_005922 [Aspergillus parasiticus]
MRSPRFSQDYAGLPDHILEERTRRATFRTSPQKLCPGWTVEKICKGSHLKRNEVICNVDDLLFWGNAELGPLSTWFTGLDGMTVIPLQLVRVAFQTHHEGKEPVLGLPFPNR